MILSHLALSAVLLAMGVPRLGNIAAQLSSGHFPPEYWIAIAAVATPIVLALLILWALITWTRGSHGWLIVIDLGVIAASWSLLLVLLLANDSLPLVTLVLAPLALVLAAVVPRLVRRSETSRA